MAQDNEGLLRESYDAFAQGDLDAVLSRFSDDIVFHFAGDNRLSGHHRGKDAVMGFFGKLWELSGGTFRVHPQEILAGEDYAAVPVLYAAQRAGDTLDARAVHVWHIAGGVLSELWEQSPDQDELDRFWR